MDNLEPPGNPPPDPDELRRTLVEHANTLQTLFGDQNLWFIDARTGAKRFMLASEDAVSIVEQLADAFLRLDHALRTGQCVLPIHWQNDITMGAGHDDD